MANKFWTDNWVYVTLYKVDVAEEQVLTLKAANSEDLCAKGFILFYPYQNQKQVETAISFCSDIKLSWGNYILLSP